MRDPLGGEILRGVYREPLRGACPEILRFAQNDNRRAQSDSKRSESAQNDTAEHFFSNLLDSELLGVVAERAVGHVQEFRGSSPYAAGTAQGFH